MAEQDFRGTGAPGYDSLDDEIDLFELFQNLWEDKWLIGAITSAAAMVSVLVALWLLNIYQALRYSSLKVLRGALGASHASTAA